MHAWVFIAAGRWKKRRLDSRGLSGDDPCLALHRGFIQWWVEYSSASMTCLHGCDALQEAQTIWRLYSPPGVPAKMYRVSTRPRPTELDRLR
jgi:hypothetical protein